MEPEPEEKAPRASPKTRQPQTEVNYHESISCQKDNGLLRPKCRQGMPGSIALARRAAPLLLAPRAGRKPARGPLPTWQHARKPSLPVLERASAWRARGHLQPDG